MVTRWSPDTCGCVVEYDEKINWVATIEACEKHKDQVGPDHLAAVLDHNGNKNNVITKLVQLNPGLDPLLVSAFYDVTAPSSNDPIIITGITKEQFTALQAFLPDTKQFGE